MKGFEGRRGLVRTCSATLLLSAVCGGLAGCTSDDVTLSDPGWDQSGETVALGPTLAIRTTANDFVAVWDGDPLADSVENREVHARRASAATATPIDAAAIQISNTTDVSHSEQVAYSPAHDEYLIVWNGIAGSGYGVFAQRMNAATGALVGSPAQIGVGSGGPTVLYNSIDDEYMVLWDTGLAGRGQRIDAATGLEIGADDFTSPFRGGTAITFNATDDQYLGVAAGQHDITAIRMAADGTAIEPNTHLVFNSPLRITEADVSYAPELGWYLVAWGSGEQCCSAHTEVFGELLHHDTLEPVGAPSFPISNMGSSSDPATQASQPSVAWDPGALEFVVAFRGRDGTASVSPADEVFAQRVYAPTATLSCASSFRVSDRSPLNAPNYPMDSAQPISVGVVPSSGQVVVVWDAYAAIANPFPPPPFVQDFNVMADVFPRGCAS